MFESAPCGRMVFLTTFQKQSFAGLDLAELDAWRHSVFFKTSKICPRAIPEVLHLFPWDADPHGTVAGQLHQQVLFGTLEYNYRPWSELHYASTHENWENVFFGFGPLS